MGVACLVDSDLSKDLKAASVNILLRFGTGPLRVLCSLSHCLHIINFSFDSSSTNGSTILDGYFMGNLVMDLHIISSWVLYSLCFSSSNIDYLRSLIVLKSDCLFSSSLFMIDWSLCSLIFCAFIFFYWNDNSLLLGKSILLCLILTRWSNFCFLSTSWWFSF